MQKLTKEQAEGLIEQIKAYAVKDKQIHSSQYMHDVDLHFCAGELLRIINQCTEKQFPAFSFETQDHRIISMHQVVNRAALNNEFFLDKDELMHLVLGIEKIIDWMEENEQDN